MRTEFQDEILLKTLKYWFKQDIFNNFFFVYFFFRWLLLQNICFLIFHFFICHLIMFNFKIAYVKRRNDFDFVCNLTILQSNQKKYFASINPLASRYKKELTVHNTRFPCVCFYKWINKLLIFFLFAIGFYFFRYASYRINIFSLFRSDIISSFNGNQTEKASI